MSAPMRRVGGAHRGLDMWLMQRASAIYLALFMLLAGWTVLTAGPLDYTTWQSLFVPMTAKLATLLFIASLLVHAWIGLREIFIDYAQHLGLRLALYLVFAVLYLGCLAWSVDILWSVK